MIEWLSILAGLVLAVLVFAAGRRFGRVPLALTAERDALRARVVALEAEARRRSDIAADNAALRVKLDALADLMLAQSRRER